MTQKHVNTKLRCHVRCETGRPERGYLCRCTACQGKLHGSVAINLHTLQELVDRKLMDPTLNQREFERWLAVMESLMRSPMRLRQVTRKRG